jgi:citrate lyase subunit beta/citryl-CoA lyase
VSPDGLPRSPAFALGPALLFCPADRPDRYRKALDRADAVVLDLEDAVAPDRRIDARVSLVDTPLDPQRTIVRINPYGTDDYSSDLRMLRDTDYRFVMLAKADSTVDFEALGGFTVIGLCETAAGVMDAARIAAQANVGALMWGAEDLVASMGGTSSRGDDGRYRSVITQARATVALAAAAHAVAMVDAVYLDIADHSGLAEEARDAAALGFVATACIHPSQVDVIREAYRPTEADVAWADGVLGAVAAAGGGVARFEGRMVDGPILRHAESVLRRAARQP